MWKAVVIASIGFVLACKSGKDSGARAPSCDDVARHAASLVQDDDVEQRKVVELVTQVCAEEAWSVATRRCVLAAKDEATLDRCNPAPTAPDEPPAASTTADAELNLDAIKKGLKAYFIENAAFPEGAAGPIPTSPCCESGRPDRKCQAALAAWRGTPETPTVWDQVQFEIDAPQAFRYAYEGSAEHVTVTATGDLDCDGTEITFTLTAEANAGAPIFTLTRPDGAD